MRAQARTWRWRSGFTASRKLIVSTLMIIRSRKLAVIQMMSYLSRDTRIRTTIIANESAPAMTGRRSKASQKKLSTPHVRQKMSFGTKPTSLQTMSDSAARCSAAISAIGNVPRGVTASGAAGRLVRNARDGGMAAARARQ